MKCIAFTVCVILAALSLAKGRVLQDTPTFETVSYNGTYTTDHLAWKHTLAVFPYFGEKCTAHINVYGIFVGSPYTYGDIQLQIVYPRASTDNLYGLKNVLCDLMRTTEYKDIFSWELLYSSGMIIYDDSNGKIILSGSAISLAGVGVGSVHFEGCSC